MNFVPPIRRNVEFFYHQKFGLDGLTQIAYTSIESHASIKVVSHFRNSLRRGIKVVLKIKTPLRQQVVRM